MPHFWNNTQILVVTAEELIPDFYSRLEVLQVAISRAVKRGYGIRKVQSGGNGRQLLIDYDSLPENIRLQLGDPRKPLHVMEPFYKTDSAAVDFYSTHKPSGKYIKPDVQEGLVTNASMLGALGRLKIAREQERLSKGGSLRGLWDTLAADCTSFNKILKQKWSVEHTLPSNEQRLRDRFNTFSKDGYESLVSKNYGNESAKKVTDDLVELLNNMFCDKKPSFEEVSRQYDAFLDGYFEVINTKTGEKYDPKSFCKISKSSVYNYLAQWSNAIGTHLKRSGDRQIYMGKYIPAASMELPKYAGSILSIDDRQPAFKLPDGNRVWFYNGCDVASGAIIAWVYGTDKAKITTEFYRQLVRQCYDYGTNIPGELEAESNQNSSFVNTFLKEGQMFQYVRIEANNARGKYIENVNRQLRYQLEKQNENWIARPFSRSESNQAGPKKEKEMYFDDIAKIGLKALQDWNNMPHAKNQEISKFDYYLANQNPNLRPTNYKAIIPYLGFKTETSCNAGIINMTDIAFYLGDNGSIYFGEKLVDLMSEVEGRDLDIYWLDANDGSIIKAYVYLRGDDQMICEAIPAPKYVRARMEQTDKDREAIEIQSKYRASVEGYAHRLFKTIDKVITIDNRKKTVNENFQIAELKPKLSGQIRPQYDDAEEMPDVDADEIEFVPTSGRSSLRDRF
jgi:hypothetical protein